MPPLRKTSPKPKKRPSNKRARGAGKVVLEDNRQSVWGLPGLLIGGLLLLLLPRVVLFAQLGSALIGWRWQFDYDEGININATMQVAQGHNIYAHNGPGGFLSASYTPIFFLLNAIPARFTGPSFGIGRGISFLSTLAIAALLLYLVLRFARTYPPEQDARPLRPSKISWLARPGVTVWGAGLLAGMLWLSLSPVIVWAAFYKQDMLALALGLAGLVWTLRHPTPRAIFISALFFALAFYTKQSAVSAATATLVWLFMRDRRLGLRLLFLLLLFVPVPLLVVNAYLQGGIWEHLVGNQALSWSGEQLHWVLSRVWGEYWPLLLCGGLGLVGLQVLLLGKAAEARQGKRREKMRSGAPQPLPQIAAMPDAAASLVVLYVLLGVLSSLVQMGGEGANFNHALDGLLPVCLLVGFTIARASAADGRREPAGSKQSGKNTRVARGGLFRLGHNPAIGAILLGSAVLLSTQLSLYKDPRSWFYNKWPNADTDAQMRYLSALVAKTPGDIYSEDLYLLLSNGRRVLYDDPSTLVPLANAGRWDESALVSAINDRRFALILFWDGSTRWTGRGFSAFRRSYKLKAHGTINAYVPTAPSIELQAGPMNPAQPDPPVVLHAGPRMEPKARGGGGSK
jgi:hypothetical protein